MKTFKNLVLTEGLIQVPPKVFKKFEGALLTFAFSHMVVEVDVEFIKVVKNVARKYGVRRFVKAVPNASVMFKNPHHDIPYADLEIDPSDRIDLFMVFDEREIIHNADYDIDHPKTGNPAITFYVSNYVREIREAFDEDDAISTAEQTATRLQADLRHELMHYVQDVFLQNKDEKQNQQGKMSGAGQMTPEDEIEYFTSQQEFDPTIRSEIGEFLAARSYQPNLLKHMRQSKFFNILKKHKPKMYVIAAKKFVSGVQRFLDSKKTK